MTNLVGNGVATIVVSRWEQELDTDRMTRMLNNEPDLEPIETGLSVESPQSAELEAPADSA